MIGTSPRTDGILLVFHNWHQPTPRAALPTDRVCPVTVQFSAGDTVGEMMPWRSHSTHGTTTSTKVSEDNDKPIPRHPMATATVEGLPPPVLAGGSVSSRRTNRKRVRVDRGLAAHWARLKRRMGTGTAPSTSSHVYEVRLSAPCNMRIYSRFRQTSAGDSSVYLHRTCLKRPEEEEDCGEVDEVVVDRQWSDEIKSTVPSENGGNGHERSGGGSHTVGHDKAGASGGGGGGAGAGTSTDRDSFAWRADGVWSSWFPLIVLRYRLWPVVLDFFSTRFADVESERHFRKEGWFFRKSLALGSALFFVVNWCGVCSKYCARVLMVSRVLSSAFTPKVGITDKVFIWGFQTLLTIPIPLLVMYDYPRDHQFFYQAWLAVSTWSWCVMVPPRRCMLVDPVNYRPTYSVIYMYATSASLWDAVSPLFA